VDSRLFHPAEADPVEVIQETSSNLDELPNDIFHLILRLCPLKVINRCVQLANPTSFPLGFSTATNFLSLIQIRSRIKTCAKYGYTYRTFCHFGRVSITSKKNVKEAFRKDLKFGGVNCADTTLRHFLKNSKYLVNLEEINCDISSNGPPLHHFYVRRIQKFRECIPNSLLFVP
jgi:hypothetical protein